MRSTLASALLIASCPLWADAAIACSCERPTAESLLRNAAVFTGVARQSIAAPDGQSVTTFTVVESFKGTTAGATLRVLHRTESSVSCGVQFTPGQTYTLAAYVGGSGQGLATSLCSRLMFSPKGGDGDIIRRMREIRDR